MMYQEHLMNIESMQKEVKRLDVKVIIGSLLSNVCRVFKKSVDSCLHRNDGKCSVTAGWALIGIGLGLIAGSVAVGYSNVSHWELVVFAMGSMCFVPVLRKVDK